MSDKQYLFSAECRVKTLGGYEPGGPCEVFLAAGLRQTTRKTAMNEPSPYRNARYLQMCAEFLMREMTLEEIAKALDCLATESNEEAAAAKLDLCHEADECRRWRECADGLAKELYFCLAATQVTANKDNVAALAEYARLKENQPE